jgi:uncharacterized RDD family membrane protein YckC
VLSAREFAAAMASRYLGLIWATFDSRKQGWHDNRAGTIVIYESGR